MRQWLILGGLLLLFSLSACAKRDAVVPDESGGQVANAAAVNRPLAQRLPAETLVYSAVDVAALLDLMEKSLLFVDEDLGREMVVQARRLQQGLQSMVRNHGLQARLLEHWHTTRLHLLVLRQEPQRAQAGPEKKNADKGLLGQDVCVSLIVETTPDLAVDFLQQIRSLLVRQAEDGTGSKEFVFKELEIEQGQMLELEGSGLTLGQVGGLLVFSDKQPIRLWKSLLAGPAKSLADRPDYARVSQDKPAWFFSVDVAGLVADWGRGIGERLDELQAAVDQPNPGIWRIEKKMAEEQLQTFRFMQELLSLDRLRSFSGQLDMQLADDTARFMLQGQLEHDPNLAPAMRALLDGGRHLVLPAGGHDHALGLMWRFGLQEIYHEVIERLSPDELAAHQTRMNLVKEQTGYAAEDLLGLFSGDVYLMLDMEQQPSEISREVPSSIFPRPVFSVLLGVGDREKSVEAVGAIVERLAPMTATFLSRRSFQGEEVFLFGPGASSPDTDPRGAGMMSAAVLDRHLVVGDWGKVTDLMRQRQAGAVASGVLAQALQREPEASLLVVASQKLSEQIGVFGGKDKTTAQLIKDLRALEMPDEDPQTVSMVTDSLARLVELSEEMQKRSAALQVPVGVLRGQARSDRFELEIVNELRRQAPGGP